MKIARTVFAYLLAVAVTYVLATAFYTQQVIARGVAEMNMVYSRTQQIDTFVDNFTGLWQMSLTIALAFAIAMPVAFLIKRVLKPLAVVAYPIAGAAAMLAMLWAIEQVLGGGAGVIGGARDAVGLALQALAGFIGGAVFAFKRPR